MGHLLRQDRVMTELKKSLLSAFNNVSGIGLVPPGVSSNRTTQRVVNNNQEARLVLMKPEGPLAGQEIITGMIPSKSSL